MLSCFVQGSKYQHCCYLSRLLNDDMFYSVRMMEQYLTVIKKSIVNYSHYHPAILFCLVKAGHNVVDIIN